MLLNYETVKLFGAEKLELGAFGAAIDGERGAGWNAAVVECWPLACSLRLWSLAPPCWRMGAQVACCRRLLPRCWLPVCSLPGARVPAAGLHLAPQHCSVGAGVCGPGTGCVGWGLQGGWVVGMCCAAGVPWHAYLQSCWLPSAIVPHSTPLSRPRPTPWSAGLVVCVRGVVAGQLSVGDVVLFLSLMTQLMAPLTYFSSYYRQASLGGGTCGVSVHAALWGRCVLHWSQHLGLLTNRGPQLSCAACPRPPHLLTDCTRHPRLHAPRRSRRA